jgi:excisionase family DNA binding protein
MKKKVFGTYQIAKVCHVTPTTVGRWIQEGKIPYFTTGGGHRRVWDSDLIKFLRSHNIPLPDGLRNQASLKILVVDDELATRKLISRILRRSYPEAELHEAADGFEAGHKIGDLIPTLILLDLRLPGIDGIKMCQAIRRNRNLGGIKILAISGHSVQESAKESLRAGADDFLPKPFDIASLLKKVSKLLSRPPQTKKT